MCFYITTPQLCKCAVCFKSDHDIPYIIYQFTKEKRGPGFWKLNTSLLNEKEYCEVVIEAITEHKKQTFDSPTKKLEFINMKVRGLSIRYSAWKKKAENNKLRAIEKKLQEIKNDIVSENPLFHKASNQKQIELLQNERTEILQKRMRGAMIRVRREWLEYGEKNSKYLFGLEKANYKRKNRFRITSDEGQILTKNQDILKEQKHFYQDLYESTQKQLPENFLDKITLPVLTVEEKTMLATPITQEEVKFALWDMPQDKVTGPEGIPPEFYRKFYKELGQLLFYVIEDAAKTGFSKILNRSVISLMEKEGRDMSFLKHWRPLSLLNTEWKLLSKVLAIRLNRVLPRIIHTDQSGFIKG